jgi:hypothetical protein
MTRLLDLSAVCSLGALIGVAATVWATRKTLNDKQQDVQEAVSLRVIDFMSDAVDGFLSLRRLRLVWEELEERLSDPSNISEQEFAKWEDLRTQVTAEAEAFQAKGKGARTVLNETMVKIKSREVADALGVLAQAFAQAQSDPSGAALDEFEVAKSRLLRVLADL